MLIIDAHCDTISIVRDRNLSLYNNSLHVDIERMKAKGAFVQFFAAFIDPSYGLHSMKRAIQLIDKLYQQLDVYKDYIALCHNCNEIENTVKSQKVAAIISIEGGEALQGDLSALRMFYRLGVRSICLTWNYRNEIAEGVEESSGGGLTLFGQEVVKEMNNLGMIIDLSHISEKGFWDVIEISKTPVIASHSNAKRICNHKRNLSDEQIEAIKRNKGVMGINLCPDFLSNSCEASIKDIIDHIEHIAGIAGCDYVGLGADFDGIENTPSNIRGVQDIDTILNELLKLNYPYEFVEKFAGGNFLRVIGDVCK